MINQLKDDLKTAQLEKDELKTSVLRLLLSEIHNSAIQKGSELTEDEITSVLNREAKKRKEAATAFKNAGREDQSEKEEAELKILESYLPEQVSTEELTKVVTEVINELGANSMQDMGKVIGQVLSKLGTSVDGSRVSQVVKEKLTNS